jgi:two-component system sensor histidine kinase QseC
MSSAPSLRSTLRWRLLWLIVPLVLASMAVHWWLERNLLLHQFDESLVGKAKTLATLATEEGGRLELNFADEYMPEYSRAEQPYFFQVWRADGRLLERSYSLGGTDLPLRRGTLEQPARFEASLGDGRTLRCVGIEFPVRIGTPPAAQSASELVIVLGAETSALRAPLRRGLTDVALTGCVSVIAIAVAVQLTLRKSVSLLERVADEVDAASVARLTRPFDEARAPLEVRPIVASLNRALSALRGMVEREQRFALQVAHELRTPISELRAAADVALRWPDDESARTFARNARAIGLEMSELVESLLALAELESAEASGARRQFDLSPCLAALVEQVETDAAGGPRIALDVPCELRLETVPRLWEVTLRNLLDNALSHSPAGSQVRVFARPDRDGALVCVSNPTRSSAAREGELAAQPAGTMLGSPNASGHFGLGLSIVEAATAKVGHRFAVRWSDGVFHATVWRSGESPPALPQVQPSV